MAMCESELISNKPSVLSSVLSSVPTLFAIIASSLLHHRCLVRSTKSSLGFALKSGKRPIFKTVACFLWRFFSVPTVVTFSLGTSGSHFHLLSWQLFWKILPGKKFDRLQFVVPFFKLTISILSLERLSENFPFWFTPFKNARPPLIKVLYQVTTFIILSDQLWGKPRVIQKKITFRSTFKFIKFFLLV